MAILVIQLARFGDIFQTLPALNALKRARPETDVHLLVRERFQEAAHLAEGITVHALPTAAVLESAADGDLERALNKLEGFVAGLRARRFERVINLSFSPFSSYLADALECPDISGYTRHSDGYLSIPDDSSAYFYAQVGVGRSNRYHLNEIFAAVAGADLADEDFRLGVPAEKSDAVIVHVGASQNSKIYPPEMWREVLPALEARGCKLVVVGGSAEQEMAEKICAGLNADNRVGRSTLADLCRWIGGARLLIGADSAPVHIAAFYNTPVLNLSCATVSFWETGPWSAGSRVLYGVTPGRICPTAVVTEAAAMLEGGPVNAYAVRPTRMGGFKLSEPGDDFSWRLIQALYTAADYPPLPVGSSELGFHRLYDTAELAVQQLKDMKPAAPNRERLAILQSIDEILVQLPQHDPLVAPVVSWFQTERLRIGPGSPEAVLARTRELFEQLQLVSAVYFRPLARAGLCRRAGELAAAVVPQLREFEFQPASAEFQDLLSALQDLGRHTTKVGGAGGTDWSSVLRSLHDALNKGDLLAAADVLQFELPEWLAVVESQTETKDHNVIL